MYQQIIIRDHIQSWIRMEETQVHNADEYDQEMPQSQTTNQSTNLQERDTEHLQPNDNNTAINVKQLALTSSARWLQN